MSPGAGSRFSPVITAWVSFSRWLTEAAVALIAVRVVRGVVAMPYARLAQFVRGPGTGSTT